MSKKQNELFIMAMRQYGRIFLCGKKTSWQNCFSNFLGKLYFWFNTEDGSTHVVSQNTDISESMQDLSMAA